MTEIHSVETHQVLVVVNVGKKVILPESALMQPNQAIQTVSNVVRWATFLENVLKVVEINVSTVETKVIKRETVQTNPKWPVSSVTKKVTCPANVHKLEEVEDRWLVIIATKKGIYLEIVLTPGKVMVPEEQVVITVMKKVTCQEIVLSLDRVVEEEDEGELQEEVSYL